MRHSKNKKIQIIAFLFVLYFTFVLRAHSYERVPTAGHLDEMLYAWSGIHLVEDGVPVSWSTLDYPDRAKVFSGEINYKGGIPKAGVTLYKPWLDEPPLFSYLVGWFAHYFGAEKMQFIPSSFIRFPVVLISTLTSIFVFLIAKKISGFWTGLLAMLIYGTVPVLVFGSRTAMPENVIALFLALTIYLLMLFKETKKFGYLIPIPLMIGLAGLSKPTGFFILPIALFWVIRLGWKQNLKRTVYRCGYLIALTLPFLAFFFWWGLHLDSEIFWIINSIQSSRPVGWGSLAWFLITPAYDITVLRDSWYVFLLLSMVYFLFKGGDRKRQLVVLSLVYWVIVVMISGGENDLLAWYRFPTFPFLAIVGAWGVKELVKRPDFFRSFLAVGLLLGNRMLHVNAFYPNVNPMVYRILLTLLLLPSLLLLVMKNEKLKKLSLSIIVGIVAMGIYLNASYVYRAFDIRCMGMECPIVESTWLSELSFPTPLRQILLRLPKAL